MNKCTGIMGRIFGHRWEIKRELIEPKVWRDEDGDYISGHFELIEHAQCQRCGAVAGEKK